MADPCGEQVHTEMPTENQTDGAYECPDGREYRSLTAYLNHLAQHHPEET